MITIKELSLKLGVSTTTISNVINGKSNQVSKEMVKKVQEALEKYNYVPNLTAVNLASKKSKLIGIGIISYKEDDNYLKDAFVGELLGSIGYELKKYGYYMQTYTTPNPMELLNTVSSWNVDGLILFGANYEIGMTVAKRFRKPKVYIDSYVDIEKVGGVQVKLDDEEGGYLMGKYLLEKGHKRIAFLADNLIGGNLERFNGLKRAVFEHNMEMDLESYVKLEATERKMEKGLKKAFDKKEDYSVFFCASDFHALSLLNYLRDREVRVPEEVSIAGFDGNIYSKMSRPKITTVRQEPSRKGEVAVEHIMKQIEGEEYSERIVLPVELIEGGTVLDLSGEKENT